MTDYVDKLEKQMDRALDRITELEGFKSEAIKEVAYWSAQAGEWAAKCGERDARIAELEAALKPFAELNIVVVTLWEGDVGLYAISASYLRAARAALGEKND